MRWARPRIVVTHDVQESLKIVDYVYFVSDGVIVAAGHAGRNACFRQTRSCTSSCMARRMGRCRSITRQRSYGVDLRLGGCSMPRRVACENLAHRSQPVT